MPESFIYKQLNLISFFGDSIPAVVVVTVVLSLFLFYKNYKDEALLLIVSLSSILYSWALKGLFKQPRPDIAIVKVNYFLNLYSFPSSHVVFYTVFFGYLLYLAFKLKKLNSYLRHFAGILSIYFITLVGISRVLLGMHWPLDAIGGYFFGGIFLLAIIYLDKVFTKNQK